jgi:DNA-binding CsgD family transcriptional regulator
MALMAETQRPLTPRQREVLAHLAQGDSNKEIAADLGITEQGVKSHISRLLAIHGATNRTELVSVTKAWAAADADVYDAMDKTMRGVRRSIAGHRDTAGSDGDGRPVPGMHELGRQASRLSDGASPDVSLALGRLREIVLELNVAIELARDLPVDDTTKSLVKAVRRRATEAEKHVSVLEQAVRTARG